jgi:hypothetical protein
MNVAEPCGERDVAVLEDRADADSELSAASFALPDAGTDMRALSRLCLRRELIRLSQQSSVGADSAIWPPQFLDKLACGIFGTEVFG